MRKREAGKIIFFISLIFFLLFESSFAFAKENTNYIEFLNYNKEILILKNNDKTVLISEGNNIEGVREIIDKEDLKEIDLFVLRSIENETNKLIKILINKSKVDKILIPDLSEIDKDTIDYIKEKNIEIESMEEGFNYNKESISLNAKKLEGYKEGMIFASLDNIKFAVLSKNAYDSAINLSNTEDCKVEILNLVGTGKENKKEIKRLVNRLKPLVIIDSLDNKKDIESLGIENYNLNEEKRLKIIRVLGETKEFKILKKR